MSEYNPDAHLILDTNLGERRLDRHNSSLFTFLGENAMYNHVFVQSPEQPDTDEENVTYGIYLFKHNPAYESVVAYMGRNQFVAHLNLLDVADCDRRAFENSLESIVTEDLDEERPDWFK